MSSKPKAAKKAAAPRKKGANGYKLPDPIPNGEVLQDMTKKKWRIGPSIGVGGFGEIYSACEHESTSKKTTQYPYVIKIEPHGNGPLFVEMHFYMRNAKKDDVEEFKKTNKVPTLGMPLYIGSGSHECNGEKYRFVVMERFGKDLWYRFLESGRLFPTHTVFRIAIQMLDVLQYIHSRTYVHADIKGGNILFGMTKATENQAYLVDFGLASHYTIKEYKFDPKKAHNGTIEYTSRDAHNGVPTRRGDMEILGYNLVQWLAGSLPWEADLKSPVGVQGQKDKAMQDVPAFLRKTFLKSAPPSALTSYMQYVSKMEYNDAPDYKKCRQMFETGLKSLGYSNNCLLEFTPSKGGKSPKQKSLVDEYCDSSDIDSPVPIKKTKPNKNQKVAKGKKITTKVASTLKVPDTSSETIIKTTPKLKLTQSSIATQTSIERPKVNKIDTPCDNLPQRTRRNAATKKYHDLSGSSVDFIDNSLTEATPKKATKRKHTKKVEIQYASDEEVMIQTTIKKKGATTEPTVKSWRNSPAIVNGKPVKVKTEF